MMLAPRNEICGGAMIRMSLPYLYGFAAQLERAANIQEGEQIGDRWIDIILAKNALDQLYNGSVFSSSLRSSRSAAQILIGTLSEYDDKGDSQEKFTWHQAYLLNNRHNELKTILLAEMETLNAHFVTQKRGYDTLALIETAEVIFPDSLRTKAPAAIPDIREAGKCLAFELPTAAGFHLHRAHEVVLRLYYDAVTDGADRPRTRNIGDYLKAMDKLEVGDPKVKSALKDLKDMHRNPLIHPDDSLENIDEAIALLGSIHNVTVHMLKVIPPMPNPPAEVA